AADALGLVAREGLRGAGDDRDAAVLERFLRGRFDLVDVVVVLLQAVDEVGEAARAAVVDAHLAVARREADDGALIRERAADRARQRLREPRARLAAFGVFPVEKLRRREEERLFPRPRDDDRRIHHDLPVLGAARLDAVLLLQREELG